MHELASSARKGRKGAIWLVLAASSLAAAIPALAQGSAGYRLGAYDPYATFSANGAIGIEHVYIPWQDANLASLEEADRYARKRGRDLLITVEPWSWSRSRRIDPASLHSGIMAGTYDGTIQAFCRTARSLASPVTIRWGHEMDIANKRYPWSQWTPAQYIAAYRHFVDRCRTIATKAKFMWSPRGEANLRDYYPGDRYVDSIGLAIFGYEKYEIGVFGKSLSLAERLRRPYDLVVSYRRPVYIAEFGCFGADAYWKRCMSEAKKRPDGFPEIAGVVYFNEVETYPWPSPYGFPDWRIGKRPLGSVGWARAERS